MSMIYSTDSDFRICRIEFGTLLEIQREAEDQGWATRWTSVEALRSQVNEEAAILQTLMREERSGSLRAYRCLVLFASSDSGGGGGVATIDVSPARFEALERIDQDPITRKAFAKVFSLAMGGISMTIKN